MRDKVRNGAFTLIELLIVIAIAVIIAGGLVPLFSTTKQDAKVAKMLSLADTLKDACRRYYFDTGQLSIETGNAAQSCPSANRQLSCDSGVSGWGGPYISKPLSSEDNPWSSVTNLARSTQIIFDFDGDGSDNQVAGHYCNYLEFGGDSTMIVKKINDALDKGVPGNWMTTGKVEYDEVAGGARIYLFSSKPQ